MKNNTSINQLDKAFKAYGKSLSGYDQSVVNFVIKNVEPTKFQWLANQIFGFEQLTHKSISMDSVKKIIGYKEKHNNSLIPELGDKHIVFGRALFRTASRTIWSNYNFLHHLFHIGDKQIVELNW